MKLVVLGAAGKLGSRLVGAALARGHEVTASVRSPALFAHGWAGAPPAKLRIVQADAREPGALEATLAGHDAMVSAAGNVADGARFSALFEAVVTAAERVMGSERRVWMLAGAAVLDIPNAARIGLDLPFMPALYRPHLANWRRIERARLDWALMCPGPLVPGGVAHKPPRVHVSIDTLPYGVGAWSRFAPPLALSLMMKRNLPRITVSYEAVAEAIMDRLSPGGACSRRRVGIGFAAMGSDRADAA